MNADLVIKRLGGEDQKLMESLLDVCGEAFGERETYGAKRPSDAYLGKLLSDETFFAVAALFRGRVVGGLAAYELRKFEQERSEIYIYDLAVEEGFRRQGVATALIRELQRIGARCGAYVIFVQADRDDAPAVALYEKLGIREDVLHFDIPIR